MQASKKVFLMSLFGVLTLSGCSGSNDDGDSADGSSSLFELLGESRVTTYDGNGNGLLGGLGLSVLQTAPEFYADAMAPTVAELRTNAIHANYTALVDQSAEGGFGTLYGPIDDTMYGGSEHMVFVGSGINRATLMVQIPDNFNTENPCLVAAPSSGSRGVYGAVGTGGAFGIENGCAVAYTDANKGTGAVDLTQQLGFGLQLEMLDLTTTEEEASFVVPTKENVGADLSDYASASVPTQSELDAFVADNPNRLAFKHAHSQKNIEKDWGLHTLQSVNFGFKVLSEQFETEFNSANTLVLGASVSNGGAAILRAVEQDGEGLFDGVVVGEPNINPQDAPVSFSIAMGERDLVIDHSKPAYEYFALAELYAGCASKAPENAGALFAELRGDTAARCDALVAAGLLTDGSYEEEGSEAAQKLNNAGYLTESNRLLVGYAGIDLFQSLLGTYGNAYTRSSVIDSLCSVSMAHVIDGESVPGVKPDLANFAAVSNGIPRTGDIYLIKDDSPTGPTLQTIATSASGEADYNFEGAQCWYDLWADSENALNASLLAGIEEIKGNGNLGGVPTIIVHGRDDALIPVNHSSRPYYVLNKQREGENSNVVYYEVKNSQHLDTLNQLYASVSMSYVPIDYYFKQGLELMLDHLRNGTPLPPSQVVQATAPAGALAMENLVPISADATDLITYENAVLSVPE